MTLKDAIILVHDDLKIGYPLNAYETNNFFVFNMGNDDLEPILNDATFVIDKRKGDGRWIPFHVLRKKGLGDTSNFIRKYNKQDIRRCLK